MGVKTLQAVYSPFRGRVVHVTPEQAEILEAVERMIELYRAAEGERARLFKAARRDKKAELLLDDLLLIDEPIAGCASFCARPQRPDNPEQRMQLLKQTDPRRLLPSLDQYPQLREYIFAAAHARELVMRYWEQNYLAE